MPEADLGGYISHTGWCGDAAKQGVSFLKSYHKYKLHRSGAKVFGEDSNQGGSAGPTNLTQVG